MTKTHLDKDTFCALVVREQDTMFRAAKAILRSDQDAEDAVQEAICSAFANREQLRETDRFRPWILRILTNKCYDLCRKRRPQIDLADVEEYLPAPETDLHERMTLWQAVLALGEDLRLPVTLFYYEGLSIREIAGILELSEAAVKTRLSRARGRLRELLTEN